ncbi:iron copper transporter [Trichodelitschia bisporula]|uniref:Iron copper transporter n=1 Tax=Trichodelitschia bisporula TaxID=703511 RepID=A0A6G1HTE6_9PEZI|nr:iron copper transporter [Trichodelitschia bisporula]
MPQHTYKFNVAMSCGGCSGAVERVLKKLDGIDHYEVSLEKQTAEIVTTEDSPLDFNTVLTTIKKTGKKVKSGEEDGKELPIDVAASATEPNPVPVV